MQKLSYEPEFLSFILRKLCEKGGTRMLIPILDLTKEMQKLDALSLVNLHRKQYGNTEGALKAMKKPCFIIDNVVIKMKEKPFIDKLYEEKAICLEDYQFYVKTYEENKVKIIEVMRINKQNQCKVHEIYSFSLKYTHFSTRTVGKFIRKSSISQGNARKPTKLMILSTVSDDFPSIFFKFTIKTSKNPSKY